MAVKPIFIQPAFDTSNPERAGLRLIVRDPDRDFQALPDDGAWVNPTTYWETMLKDGAVTRESPPNQD